MNNNQLNCRHEFDTMVYKLRCGAHHRNRYNKNKWVR